MFMGEESVGLYLSKNLALAGYTAVSEARDADVVFTYYITQDGLEDAYFDAQGLVQTAGRGTLLIDLSPSTPSFAKELNAVAMVSDLRSLEAPLAVRDATVERTFARPENLTCYAAGMQEDFEEASPMLQAVFSFISFCGPAGSAQLARAAASIMRMSLVVSLMEADALYRASADRGIVSGPLEYAMHDAVSEETAKLYDAIVNQQFRADYSIRICMAELTAALMAADDVELILPGSESCLHLLELLAIIGGSEKSTAALSLVYGDEAACAAHGLDWTRAEQTYGEAEAGFEEDDDRGHAQEGYHTGFGFSPN